MKHLLLSLIPLLAVGACSTKKLPPQVIIKTQLEYRVIPDEFLVCLPPPVVSDEYVISITKESEYNSSLVQPLFLNNEECFKNMNRIIEWNETNKSLNESLSNDQSPQDL